MTDPGFDPILDGTAAPHWECIVRRYEDGSWEVIFEDENSHPPEDYLLLMDTIEAFFGEKTND